MRQSVCNSVEKLDRMRQQCVVGSKNARKKISREWSSASSIAVHHGQGKPFHPITIELQVSRFARIQLVPRNGVGGERGDDIQQDLFGRGEVLMLCQGASSASRQSLIVMRRSYPIRHCVPRRSHAPSSRQIRSESTWASMTIYCFKLPINDFSLSHTITSVCFRPNRAPQPTYTTFAGATTSAYVSFSVDATLAITRVRWPREPSE